MRADSRFAKSANFIFLGLRRWVSVTTISKPREARANTRNGKTTSIYAYDANNLVEETNSSGGVVARYSQGLNIDEPLAMLRSSTTSYYSQDGLGSVTSLSNAAGALAQTYTFDSFGNLTASSGSLTNPFRYTGREWDTETNLQFSRHRYYDPNVGRFLCEDPLGFKSGPRFYVYVSNDPTTFFDPSGLQQQGAPVYNPGAWNDPGHVGTKTIATAMPATLCIHQDRFTIRGLVKTTATTCRSISTAST